LVVHKALKNDGYGVTGAGAVNWAVLIAAKGEKIKDFGVTGIDGVRTYFEEIAESHRGSPGDVGYGNAAWAEDRVRVGMEAVNDFMDAATCPMEKLPTYIGSKKITEYIAMTRFRHGI